MTTGNSYWCVKGGQLQGDEIFLQADRGAIAPHGELAFYRENGSRSLVLAFAPGAWTRWFAALPDGRAAAVHGSARTNPSATRGCS
jgi:hypothetical protein